MEMILIYNQCTARDADFFTTGKNGASVKSPHAE